LAQSPVISSLVEFFTLESAARTVDAVGDAARREVHAALLLGRQKATCAETLWANGHTAEGLALAIAALEETLRAAPALAPPKPVAPSVTDSGTDSGTGTGTGTGTGSDSGTDSGSGSGTGSGSPPPAPDLDTVLTSRGVGKVDLDALRAARERAREKLPTLDRDLSPAHAELYGEVMRARHVIDRALTPGALTHRDLRWTRLVRAASALAVSVGVIGGLYATFRPSAGTFATASDFFQQSPQFAPEMAIDRSAGTYWLLPDGATGWLEVAVSPPRHVGRVRVQNTTNPPYADRGTDEYRIEVYAHGQVVQTIDGRFAWTETPGMVDHDVNADDVERVRFVVRSHHRMGAGLAELQLD
jgi:hypothetical protein